MILVNDPRLIELDLPQRLDAEQGWLSLHVRSRHYDPTTGRFATLDPYAGSRGDPLSLHKYLYTHANPVVGIDPSGLFTLTELKVTIKTMARVAVRFLKPAATIYDRYDTVREAARIIFNAVKNGRFDAIGITMLTLQFLPLGGLVSKLGSKIGGAKRYVLNAANEGGDTIRYFQGVYDDALQHLDEATNGFKELMGTMGTAFVATAKKFDNPGLRISNTGLDGIFRDEFGKWVVVEAKGGLRGVRRTSDQMGQAWIRNAVEDTIRRSAGHVDQTVLDSLRAAVRNNELQGMVVNTRIANGQVTSLGFELKDWAEIGANSWR